ncbi:MAG: urea ABC transporter substrate-binding protein [Eubacterium sp.]|nr:urea ABC transporter substrate-binding protein [Eubacterium sp.]
MRKRGLLAAVLAMSLLAGCGSAGSAASAGGSSAASAGSASSTASSGASAASGDTVKVGLLHSLTGSMAISEEAVRDAEVLAIKQINADGGVLGKQIEYVEEDGESDPSTFATKAEKLIDEDQVATVFGCWTSASRKAVKPIFEDYDNLLWYPVQYEGMEDSDNIVYVGAAPNQQIVPAIQYLIDQGYKKYFLMGSDYVFPRTANEIIKAQLADAGLEVVGEEYADMDQTDFSSIISKIESSGCDVIINTLNGTGNVSFFKQMAEKNYTSDDYMTMSFSIAEEEVKTIGADILKGHLVSWNYYQTTDTPENEAFVKAYKEAYGQDRVTSDPVEAAYDAVYLWKAACEAANSTDVDDVLDAIHTGKISFKAPEGTITIDGDNQHCYKKVRIGKVNDQGLIDEVYATDDVVEPDPYLKNYAWASDVQPVES